MSTEKIILKQGSIAKMQELQELYVSTITTVCSKEYDEDQRKVWASGIENKQRWMDMLTNQFVLLAMADEQIVGFATLDKGDYIDFMYVHKDYQGQGIAAMLLTAIEQEALKHNTKLIRSDISKTARPFFERKGYKVIAEQTKVRKGGVQLTNYKMVKDL